MRLRASLLRNKLNAGTILAMTATATTRTLDDIMSALDITPTNLIQKTQLRENMQLSVSLSRNRQVRCFYLFYFNLAYVLSFYRLVKFKILII